MAKAFASTVIFTKASMLSAYRYLEVLSAKKVVCNRVNADLHQTKSMQQTYSILFVFSIISHSV